MTTIALHDDLAGIPASKTKHKGHKMKTDMNNDLLIAQLKKLVPVCEKLESTPVDDLNRASVEASIELQVNEFVNSVAPLSSRHEARDLALRIKQNPSDGRLLLSYVQKYETTLAELAELKNQLAAQN